MVDDRFSREAGYDGGDARDLTALSGGELRAELAVLSEEERALERRLEFLRGRMGLIRARLAGRGLTGVGAEELARALLGEERGRGSS